MTASQEFSLLMAVYAGDQPDFLVRAFRSSVHEQSRRPDEVVVVQDGPLRAELTACLDGLVRTCPVPVRVVVLPVNVGLACAMEAGLAQCRYDVVARMDADDVSLPSRFAVTVPVLEAGADLVGTVCGRSVLMKPPSSAAAIRRRGRRSSPRWPGGKAHSTIRAWSTGALPSGPRGATRICPCSRTIGCSPA